jgi:hypothetical protein
VLPELSVYWPTAVRLPAEAHDSEAGKANGFDAAQVTALR